MEDDVTENADVIIRSRTNSDSGISSNESNIESQAPQISGAEASIEMTATDEPTDLDGLDGEDCVVNQAPALIARMTLDTNTNIEPDTKVYIENAENQSYHGMTPKIFKNTVKKMTKEMQRFDDQPLFIKAVRSLDLDRLTTPDTTLRLAGKLFEDSDSVVSWGKVLALLNVFLQLATRVIKECPGKSGESLQCLVEQLKQAVKQHVSTWITGQGGWLAYDLPASEKITMRPAIGYLLSSCEPFIVLVSDGNDKGPMKKLGDEVVIGFEKVHVAPIVIHCEYKLCETPLDEVRFYAGFANAVFVPLMSPTTTTRNNKSLLPCYEAMTSNSSNDAHRKNFVVPVEVFGQKNKDLPGFFKKYKTLRAFPNTKYQWKQSEVRDFVGLLRSNYDTLLDRELQDILAPKTDAQLEIKVIVHINTKLTLNDKTILIQNIKRYTKANLEDPWAQIRQHLLHMYKVKNIRVADVENTTHLYMEIVSGKASDVERILYNYRSGQFESIFPDYIKVPEVVEPYSFSVELDELKARQLIATLNRALQHGQRRLLQDGLQALKGMQFVADSGKGALAKVDPTPTRPYKKKPESVMKKALILGKLAENMLNQDENFSPYDMYSLLLAKRDEVDLLDVKNNQGHNVQHMIVTSSRLEFFKVIFYLNLWDDFRLLLTDPEKDPQYGDYTPRGLAEKFLFKPKGPSTLEEYDHFDHLWLQMPLLHKACLHGSLSYVQTLLSKNPDVGEKDRADATCILYACANGSVSIVNVLIEKGADPKLENSRGENGLVMAAKFGKSAVIRLLLSRFDFNRDQVDQFKNRAIDYAAINGDIETLRAFSDGGMPPDERALSMAAKYQRQDTVVQLVRQYDLNLSGGDEDGRSPLLNAASKGNYDMLVFLIKEGAVITDRDNQNRSCLHLVAENNHDRVCGYLIHVATERGSLGEMINDRDYYNGRDQLMIVRGRDRGRKAWHYVSVKRILNHLFKKKMNSGQIDVKLFGDIHGSGYGQSPNKEFTRNHEAELADKLKSCLLDLSPLLMAAWKGHTEVANQLLAAGANPNVTDYFGSTALHLAAMRGNLELARELEQRGADIDCHNNEGKSPGDIAEVNEHPTLVNFISGKQLYKHAISFVQCMEVVKAKLSPEELSKLRSGGRDIRRHLIDTVRDLTIDVNKTLLELGSGPVQEESRDSRELQDSNRSSTEFAGPRPEFGTLPGVSAGESTLHANSLEEI